MPLSINYFNCSSKHGHPCKFLPFGFPYDLTGLGSMNGPNQLRIILGSKPNNAFIYLSVFIGIYVIIFAVFLGIALSRSKLVHHQRKNRRNRHKKRKSHKQMIVNYDEDAEDTRTDLKRVKEDLYFV